MLLWCLQKKMKEEKIIIKNRKKKKIVILLNSVKNQKGLAFIMHGLGGFKEQVHIKTFAETLNELEYTVVRFDTTNTIGESEGKYEDATATNYYEDLEDVIKWAKKKDWYEEPFVLVGHSLGGICTTLYAENHPKKVKALAPISTVVHGRLSFEIRTKEEIERWKRTGWEEHESRSKPGVIKRLRWSFVEDISKYDLLKKVDKLTMPVLMIVGSEDDRTPVKHQQILFDKLPDKKEFHVIKGAPHTFREKKHLEEIKKIFKNWIKKLK